jgi:hypothetical protein
MESNRPEMTFLTSKIIRDQLVYSGRSAYSYFPLETRVTQAEFDTIERELRDAGLIDPDVKLTHLRGSRLVIFHLDRF